MKIANFQIKDSRNKSRMGTVTLKDDGKISINIMHSRDYPTYSNYDVRKVAQEIVDSNFNHPSIINLEIIESKGLLGMLLDNTEEVKKEYIETTKEYSKREYHVALKDSKLTTSEWLEIYDLDETFVGEKYCKNYTKTNEYKNYLRRIESMKNSINLANDIASKSEIDYVNEKVELAKEHYKFSIEKLTHRLAKKGITVENVKSITNGRVGVNFECYIKHDDILTTAYTIIASGVVQSPHYRYLLKTKKIK